MSPLNLQRGLFITVEGIDGAGKSSHLPAIAAWLAAHSRQPVLQTREPGGTDLGEKIRTHLLNDAMHAHTELLLMFAARAEHCERVIKPALAAGQHVLCDRFTDATVAYQGYGRGLDLATIAQLAQMAHPDLQPDLTFIFVLDARTAQTRVAARSDKDRFEALGESFAEKVADGYAEIARAEPQRCVLIDGSAPIEVVRSAVLQTLSARLAAQLHTA